MNKIFEKSQINLATTLYIEAVKNRKGYRNCRTVNESTSTELGDWCRQVVLLIYTFVIVFLDYSISLVVFSLFYLSLFIFSLQ